MKLFNKTWKKFATAGVVAAVGVGGWAIAADAAVKPDCKNLMYPLCPRSVAAGQVVDNSLPGYKKLSPGSVSEDRLSTAVKTKLNAVGTGKPGLSAYQIAVDNGFKGTQAQWLASLKGKDGDPATDVFGKQGGTLKIDETAIDKIGGPFATNATKLGEFTLPKGTWLVNAMVQFDRTDANDPDYVAPTTDTMPSFVLRYPGDAGTIMGNAISRAGYTELTGSSVATITLTEATKITAYGFGYNEDRTSFGSAATGVKSQFSVLGSVNAVRVG